MTPQIEVMPKIEPFMVASTPHIHFGVGSRLKLTDIMASFGHRVLLVTGATSFDDADIGQQLLLSLQTDFEVFRVHVRTEPSPALVDEAVAEFSSSNIDCVLAIGGGSSVDAAKAIAGLLPTGDSVMDYLEGVGKGLAYQGLSTPFIAVPTTAGTGGETSKNAVLSVIGNEGYKKSFRHERLVAKHVILDPELSLNCPRKTTAACGMDALTQLLESYLSSKANPMTDALAMSGLKYVRDSLLKAVEHGDDIEARANMLYASSISGLTLANAGLGSVHGLASPLGAFFPVPHGVVCGTLVAEATRLNINTMRSREPQNIGLKKYAKVGRMMLNDDTLSDHMACEALVQLLQDFSERLDMPRLSQYGIGRVDFAKIIANSRGNSMLTNPIMLTDAEIEHLLIMRC